MVGKVERFPLREVWKHEAHDFTRWLQDNIEALNEVLPFDITVTDREAAAGDFSVDLVGETDSGDTVVIENQYGKSDHPHLGKLLTYLATRDAKVAVWIVEDPRPEHAATISWLNESSPVEFYLVKAEAVRIGDSEPAALFTCISYPSPELAAVGRSKVEESERHKTMREFWSRLLSHAKGKTKLHSGVSPGKDSWIGAGEFGIGGVGLHYVVHQHATRVELYLHRARPEENKAIFDHLHASKSAIESAFGAQLLWQRLDEKRASRISYTLEVGGWMDPDKWDNKVIPPTVEAMIKLHAAIEEPVRRVPQRLRDAT